MPSWRPSGNLFNWADTAIRCGDLDDARALFALIDAQSPLSVDRYRHAECLLIRCDLHLGTGDTTLAESCCREALDHLFALRVEDSTDTALAFNRLALIQRRQGHWEAAIKHHIQALGLVKSWPRYHLQVLLDTAITHLAAGQTEQAIPLMAQASSLADTSAAYPARVWTHLASAILASRQAREDAARASLQIAMSIIKLEGLYYLPINVRELAPALWALLNEMGEQDALNTIEARFPQTVRDIRAELTQIVLAKPLAPPAPPTVHIRCFGSLVVEVSGVAVTHWPRKRAKALLGWLILHPDGVNRDTLADQLFPDLGFEESQHQLDNLVSSLRKILEPHLARRQKSRYLDAKDRQIRLNTEALTIDLVDFEAAYRADTSELMETALGFYRGELLSDAVCLEFFEFERHRFRTMAITMLTRLAKLAWDSDHFAAARDHLTQLLTLDPTHEAAHCDMMRLYIHFGQRDLLKSQYQQLQQILRQELDTTPTTEAQRLSRALD